MGTQAIAERIMSLAQPVDLTHLSRYTGGDRAVNGEVLTLFATQSVELLDKLDAALKQNDSKTWRDIAHSLKGGARGIGAFQLADTAAALEDANPAEDRGRAARVLDDLKSHTRAVTLFIDKYLAR
jgi:HPt (histidine-containing phosphotransfer) domain-containing protein